LILGTYGSDHSNKRKDSEKQMFLAKEKWGGGKEGREGGVGMFFCFFSNYGKAGDYWGFSSFGLLWFFFN
jgi:hypothetical protein